MFRQLESWDQDAEDRRFSDLSDLVIQNVKRELEDNFGWEARHGIGCGSYVPTELRSNYRNGYRDILAQLARAELHHYERDNLTREFRHTGEEPRGGCTRVQG